jgi:hypothetical protein
MDRKQLCVANVQYKKPTADDRKRTKGLLRYLTYREGRFEASRQVSGVERWVDHGMGGSATEVGKQCEALQSEHVLLFSLVFNPNPDLIVMVAMDEREAFVKDLTESTLERFFEARGVDTGGEYSYVLHHRQTDDVEAPNRHNPHTHVVLPGTVYDEEHGERVPLFFSCNRKVNHIEMLHDATEQTMVEQMERYVGRDWEQRYDQLISVREQQKTVTYGEPHAVATDGDLDIPIWVGSRRTDETTSAMGIYQAVEDPDDAGLSIIQFRPLLATLPHEQAEFFGAWFAHEMQGSIKHLAKLVEWIDSMKHEQRETVMQQHGYRVERPNYEVQTHFDIEFF